MRKVLVIDCYIGGDGASAVFTPLMRGRPLEVVRAPYAPLPARAGEWDAIVITGSRASVMAPEPWEAGLLGLLQDSRAESVPVLGVCYGHQVLAKALCGPEAVRVAPATEVGWVEIEVAGSDPLLTHLNRTFSSFLSHQDEVVPTPGLQILGRSADCEVQVMRVEGERMWGVQFHPEMRKADMELSLNWRADRHPELGIDPEAELARAEDSLELAHRIFDNFFGAIGWYADLSTSS